MIKNIAYLLETYLAKAIRKKEKCQFLSPYRELYFQVKICSLRLCYEQVYRTCNGKEGEYVLVHSMKSYRREVIAPVISDLGPKWV
jgi:hypothetical protein